MALQENLLCDNSRIFRFGRMLFCGIPRWPGEIGPAPPFEALSGNHRSPTLTQTKIANFRRATALDIPAMSKIRLAVRENVLSDPARITQKMYEDYLDLLGRGWVAEIDGRVVGFSYANKTDGSIWALFISPEYEGRGLARELLNTAVGWLFDQGHEIVRLSTGSGTRADRFYAAQGWALERIEGNDSYYLLVNKDVIGRVAA